MKFFNNPAKKEINEKLKKLSNLIFVLHSINFNIWFTFHKVCCLEQTIWVQDMYSNNQKLEYSKYYILHNPSYYWWRRKNEAEEKVGVNKANQLVNKRIFYWNIFWWMCRSVFEVLVPSTGLARRLLLALFNTI